MAKMNDAGQFDLTDVPTMEMTKEIKRRFRSVVILLSDGNGYAEITQGNIMDVGGLLSVASARHTAIAGRIENNPKGGPLGS